MNTADLVLCALCNALMVTTVMYESQKKSRARSSWNRVKGKDFFNIALALELAPTTMLKWSNHHSNH